VCRVRRQVQHFKTTLAALVLNTLRMNEKNAHSRSADTPLETSASETIEATGEKYNLLTRIGHFDFRSCR
jgi:hypothetical protein